MASSENDDLALAVLRVRVRNHLDTLRGSLNEYFDVTDANEEARLESEQELAKVRETFEQSVRGSQTKSPIPERSALRDELWSEFDVDAIKQPILADTSNATVTESRAGFMSKSCGADVRKETRCESVSELIAQKIALTRERKRFTSLPTTPQGDHPPRESAGLNFTPRSQSMSAKVHLNLLRKVRVPRRIKLRLSRIFKLKPKSTPASPVTDTVIAEPADVGNLLSRPPNQT